MEDTQNQQRKKKFINNGKPDSHDKYLSIKRCYSSIEALSSISLFFFASTMHVFFYYYSPKARCALVWAQLKKMHVNISNYVNYNMQNAARN